MRPSRIYDALLSLLYFMKMKIQRSKSKDPNPKKQAAGEKNITC
jgi:hypothetical protein